MRHVIQRGFQMAALGLAGLIGTSAIANAQNGWYRWQDRPVPYGYSNPGWRGNYDNHWREQSWRNEEHREHEWRERERARERDERRWERERIREHEYRHSGWGRY